MFTPNLVGELRKLVGRDIHGRETWSDPIVCPFAIVNLGVTQQKTTVRADSSASRGAAEEQVSDRGKILIAKTVSVAIGDQFSFEGEKFLIASRFKRRSVFGAIDHFECEVEILP